MGGDGAGQHVDIGSILARLGVAPSRVETITPNHGPEGNGNWHVWSSQDQRCVLRRYYVGATAVDLAYEYAILQSLSVQGWRVPEPLAPPVEFGGRWYALTRYVPGSSRVTETLAEQRQRGADLARLHGALRSLGDDLGQRPGWHAMRDGLPVMTPLDWSGGLAALAGRSPALAEWAAQAASSAASELAAVGATALALTVIHGDFLAGENVHYDRDELAGVIDFGVAHLGSRTYDLVSARCYRAPEVHAGYVEELDRLGWPLSDVEEAAILPIYRAFRLYMANWHIEAGMETGCFDTDSITAQLAQTGIDPSGSIHTPAGAFDRRQP